MRWSAPDGAIWASKFEYEVYSGLKANGINVRKALRGPDTLSYTSPVKGGLCKGCNCRAVVQEHTYTPDLYVIPAKLGATERGIYYIEAKGYLRGPNRSLLRHFRAQRQDIDLRLIVQRDFKVGKGTLVSWAKKYLKVPVHIWNGDIPEDWK